MSLRSIVAVGTFIAAGILSLTALFALGLGISGMTRPEKVIGFLDFFGKWDYSLAFVMVGAVFTHAIAFRPLTDTAENLKKCSNPK